MTRTVTAIIRISDENLERIVRKEFTRLREDFSVIADYDLTNRFTYHAPSAEQIPKYEMLRSIAFAYARQINDLCPDGREKSLAITKLEEVVFWANAAIARHETTSNNSVENLFKQ